MVLRLVLRLVLRVVLRLVLRLVLRVVLRVEQAGKEVREAETRPVFADADGQLVDAVAALGVSGAVKQHALQRFKDAGIRS